MSDKSENPTPKRLQAREEGDSGVSTQAAQAVAFLVAVALAPSAVSALASTSTDFLKNAIARGRRNSGSGRSDGVCNAVILLVVPLLSPPQARLLYVSVQFVQTGGFVARRRRSSRSSSG